MELTSNMLYSIYYTKAIGL